MLVWWRAALIGVVVAVLPSAASAQAALAEGFNKVPGGAKVVLMPMDVELFSLTAGGILEPRADWTTLALDHLKTAYLAKKDALGVDMAQADDDGDESVEEFNRLHGAVGTAIARHHYGPYRLPTKEGRFDWTLGEGVDAIRAKTGADYALFTFVRDSYASGERVVTMVIGAMFGFGLGGGMQVGYASLVDLHDGRVVWFNLMVRGSGDLRNAEKARETLDALLNKFPG